MIWLCYNLVTGEGRVFTFEHEAKAYGQKHWSSWTVHLIA